RRGRAADPRRRARDARADPHRRARAAARARGHARARPRPRRATRPVEGHAHAMSADLLLTGARVHTPAEEPAGTWVALSEGRIEAVGSGPPPAAERTEELAGRILAPGFIDLHVHGGGGAHFMSGDPEECRRAARFHAGHGTTGLLATTLSAARDELEAAVGAIARTD